jgi:membrane protease YdiL (CAAX protease family)
MFQTFMEGFGIGFMLYRLGAWIGIRWSSVVVAFLFMAAHIPNYTSGAFHLSLPIALLAALAHAGIAVLIVFGAWKSQDIIVIGVLHWFINRVSDFTTN